MKKAIDKISSIINSICIAIGCTIFIILVISTVTQVVCRYFLHISVPWTEELARFCFIWATMLGAASLVKSNGHPAVDALTGKFTGKAKILHQIFVYLVIMIVVYIGIRYGFALVAQTGLQLSPVMKIPYSYVYLAFPVGCIATVFHLIDGIVDCIAELGTSGMDEEGVEVQ